MIAAKSARLRAYFDGDWYGELRFYIVGNDGEVFLFKRFKRRARDPEWAAMIANLRAESAGYPFLAFMDGERRAGMQIDVLGSLAY